MYFVMTKLELIARVVKNEFPEGVLGLSEHEILNMLLQEHKYLFEKHYFHAPSFEGSEEYWQLYSCVTGVLNDLMHCNYES